MSWKDKYTQILLIHKMAGNFRQTFFQGVQGVLDGVSCTQYQQDGVVARQGAHHGPAGVVVDEGRHGRCEARVGLDYGHGTGELDAQDALGGGADHRPGLGQFVSFSRHLHDMEGLQVPGQGGLRGPDALLLQFVLQFFLTIYIVLADDFKQGSLALLDVLHRDAYLFRLGAKIYIFIYYCSRSRKKIKKKKKKFGG